MTIQEKIQAHHERISGEHDRFRSWEHCYGYFRRTTPQGLSADRYQAALQLAFYLASWGMYRGSSFLLQYSFTAHLGVIDVLGKPCFSELWEAEFGANRTDYDLVPKIIEAIDGIRTAYQPFAKRSASRQASDTLVTKVILGTFGCLPACDRYFIEGFKHAGFPYSRLNRNFIEQVLDFCQRNSRGLNKAQAAIEKTGGVRYPPMKLIDMYFWQIGFDISRRRAPHLRMNSRNA
ncbi:MAG: hypothetical protein QOF72_1340 [Blastocatellia bacterium]|nr:hypothetical protein [Blastocatellia bacterium]